MNQQIFLIINGWAGHWPVLDSLGIFFADYFLYVASAVLLALWFKKRFHAYVAVAFISAFISRVVIVELMKRIFDQPRPHEVLVNVHQLLTDTETGRSFPSGHAVMYFSFAFAFWGTEYFWPFFILASLGSVARIFVGVHFPVDILASLGVAAATVWFVNRLFKKHFLG